MEIITDIFSGNLLKHSYQLFHRTIMNGCLRRKYYYAEKGCIIELKLFHILLQYHLLISSCCFENIDSTFLFEICQVIFHLLLFKNMKWSCSSCSLSFFITVLFHSSVDVGFITQSWLGKLTILISFEIVFFVIKEEQYIIVAMEV